MSTQLYPIITAEQAIAQGTTPKALIAAAQFNERQHRWRPNQYPDGADLARRLRELAREVDAATGYYAKFRGRGRHRAANDNAKMRRAAA